MSDARAALAWCPFPDADSARSVAGRLLEERLIACANILPAIESVFVLEGEISSAQECVVLFKTTVERLDALILRLGECHPYETPAIVGWAGDAAHPRTLQWLAEATGTV